MKYKYYIIFSLFVGVLLAESKAQRQADYVAAEKYRVFDLGGELSRNSLTIYPRELMVPIIFGSTFGQQKVISFIM